MDLGNYLLGKRWLKRDEYDYLLYEQLSLSVGREPSDGDGFQQLRKVSDEPLWTCVRQPPFGDVFLRDQHKQPFKDILGQVLQRATLESLEDLVEAWHFDSIREMECLGNYAPSIICARNLFENRLEKKIVARYLVSEKQPGGMIPLVKRGERIAIMEGSSGLFAAFAVAAQHGFKGSNPHGSMCDIISSNGLLNAEYLHNPLLAKSYNRFFMIGGQADFNPITRVPEHAGVYGEGAFQQFVKDWADPGATTLLVPCRGILPKIGPLAGGNNVEKLKHDVIISALEAEVHNILLIADYTKMLPSREASYGLPVFSGPKWAELLNKYGAQIKVVTTPPAALRDELAETYVHPCYRQNLAKFYPGQKFEDVDHEYNQVADQFCQTLGIARFCEALHVNPVDWELPATPAAKDSREVVSASAK